MPKDAAFSAALKALADLQAIADASEFRPPNDLDLRQPASTRTSSKMLALRDQDAGDPLQSRRIYPWLPTGALQSGVGWVGS
jgi:hypothetical protein